MVLNRHDPFHAVLERLRAALNQHDLAALTACFAPDYHSEQPLHTGAAFVGRDQVHKNWAAMFGAFPDLRSEVVAIASSDDAVWAEWRWHGTRRDAQPLDLRGVTIFRVRHDQIIWGRLYMEPVQAPEGGIERQVLGRTNLLHEGPVAHPRGRVRL